MICNSLNKDINDSLNNLITTARLLDYKVELYHVHEDYSNSKGPIYFYFNKDDIGHEIILMVENGSVTHLETITGLLKKPYDMMYQLKVKSPTNEQIIQSSEYILQQL